MLSPYGRRTDWTTKGVSAPGPPTLAATGRLGMVHATPIGQMSRHCPDVAKPYRTGPGGGGGGGRVQPGAILEKDILYGPLGNSPAG